ncbi:response regulator [Aquiflexum sp. TKW24L]|uniref:response regulator n=1 Tax=Aquiflexum sp. TKW24L TaxID=2942212 RepID=UPI0020BE3FF9|nr:response regulator [Aquiflexum sp. TKW24L]MCL6258466.1 response regulator [Aquiflexum sp. TKW24L]
MPEHIFLAEDDEEDRDLFSLIISEISADYKIFVAKDGIKFMSLLNNADQLPDFIFLDLNMPVKNGLECLQEIKNSEKWKLIKTVILSTSSHPEQIKDMYKMGANLYLKKPTSYSSFKDSLSKCLQMEWDTLK